MPTVAARDVGCSVAAVAVAAGGMSVAVTVADGSSGVIAAVDSMLNTVVSKV